MLVNLFNESKKNGIREMSLQELTDYIKDDYSFTLAWRILQSKDVLDIALSKNLLKKGDENALACIVNCMHSTDVQMLNYLLSNGFHESIDKLENMLLRVSETDANNTLVISKLNTVYNHPAVVKVLISNGVRINIFNQQIIRLVRLDNAWIKTLPADIQLILVV